MSLKQKNRPIRGASYNIRSQDISIKHVSKTKSKQMTAQELEQAELDKKFTYDDFKTYYAYFDKEIKNT